MSYNHNKQDMHNPDSSAATALMQQLGDATEGLLYMSETDAPFEVVHLPHVQDSSLLPAALVELSETAEEARVETVTLSYFFRSMTSDSPEEEDNSAVRRFRELQELIEQNLEEVQVYRIGNRRIQAFILGKTAAGGFAGLKTFLVET